MAKKTLVASIEYCCRYKLKVIWHCSKNAHRSSGLEPSNVSGAQMWDWLVVGGVGHGTTHFLANFSKNLPQFLAWVVSLFFNLAGQWRCHCPTPPQPAKSH